ncbi:Ppx/GppA phosphatase family protein [Marinifilum sp. D737]|jgi:exopolyphosphatase/guanosine-5'-triphosphate,3'-diphosphate pyrophosphatase|uniref:Ppx/GppA phosphatase family protein n=1 Tax=Marinifilum sp. D737 TaxID=2969628 RepID=UPI002272F1BA|nr:phosphatase [Marinifilum sp. D737]MCY1633124.1 phosphatase [Marinifilum sp. D737]
MKIMKFAAIDIGSNAIRLLFMNVFEEGGNTHFKKSSLIRVPIRLGTDTFIDKFISPIKGEKLIKSMKAFRHLMEVHEVVNYRACATSAMREAANGPEIIKRIEDESDIKIDIIDGKEEASIIFDNKIADTLEPDKDYLYVDVGGGSTEITLFSKGICTFSASFNVGTIKILKDCVPKGEFIRIKECLLDICPNCENIEIIGSGGNINRLVKLATPRKEKHISYKELKSIFYDLKQYSHEELMINYNMNPDRADVIIPAATIFLSVMEWAKAETIHVPKIGVSDGIVHQLYKEYKSNRLLIS